jgi:hypothetical protein
MFPDTISFWFFSIMEFTPTPITKTF